MLKTVALFAGCGGLDLGFENAGFNIIWANDNNKKYKKHIDTIIKKQN